MPDVVNSNWSHFKKVVFLIGSDRTKVLGILPLYLISSILDLFGLGLLVALLSAIRNPEAVTDVFSWLGGSSWFDAAQRSDSQIIFLSLGVLIVFALRTAFAILIANLTLRISFNFGARFRAYMMRVYQRQSYAQFMQRNTSEYINNIQLLCGQVVAYSVLPLLRTIGDGLIAVFIFVFLAIENPLALGIITCLLLSTGVVYDRAIRKKMARYGTQTNELSAQMIRHITEGMTGYKESLIFGITSYFHDAVARAAQKLSDLRVKSQLIVLSSRFVLELVVVAGVVLIIVSLIALGQNEDQLFSTLTLFIVACIRLVPTTNQIVVNVGNLRYGRHAVNVLYEDIVSAGQTSVDLDDFKSAPKPHKAAGPASQRFRHLELENVAFRYQPEGDIILDNVSLRIERLDIVAITGPSGAGKSTMMALILGLLKPDEGRLLHNGTPLTSPEVIAEWHKNVSYLPQEVFLIDDTIARNVALGATDAELDRDKVHATLERARLGDLVAQLPDGIDTSIGDKGARISGGQRQRVALARAFYFDSEVLILDESTSAIDDQTTEEILAEVENLRGKVTIILITHQQALLGLCNKIYCLNRGKLTQRAPDKRLEVSRVAQDD